MDHPLPPRDESADPLVRAYAPPAMDERASPPPHARWFAPSAYLVSYVAAQLAGLGCDLATITGTGSLFPIALLVRLLAAVIGLAWLHEQWGRLPPHYQAIDGTPVSAGAIVGRHFIPVFGVLWLFQVHVALCRALDLRLAEEGRPTGAPRGLAVAACTVWLAGRFAFAISNAAGILCALATAVLWAAYMVEIERMFALAFPRRAPR